MEITTQQGATTKEFLVVRTEGTRQAQRILKHYNLDTILSALPRVGEVNKIHPLTRFQKRPIVDERELIVPCWSVSFVC